MQENPGTRNSKIPTSGQDGGVGSRKIHFVSSHNQKKDNNQFKNKKQPELPENQNRSKSDNHGVKEKTFIQTGRRGRDGQLGQRRPKARWNWRTRWAKQWLADWAVPHSCADKPEGTTGEQDRPHNPEFQRGK